MRPPPVQCKNQIVPMGTAQRKPQAHLFCTSFIQRRGQDLPALVPFGGWHQAAVDRVKLLGCRGNPPIIRFDHRLGLIQRVHPVLDNPRAVLGKLRIPGGQLRRVGKQLRSTVSQESISLGKHPVVVASDPKDRRRSTGKREYPECVGVAGGRAAPDPHLRERKEQR